MLPTRLMKLWFIRICKNYQRSLLSVTIKYCHQSIIYTCQQQGFRNIKLNVIILYNAHLKANEVMDDWNIETSKYP